MSRSWLLYLDDLIASAEKIARPRMIDEIRVGTADGRLTIKQAGLKK